MARMGRMTDEIYLDLSKTFNAVLHDDLVSKLETWIDRWNMW